MTVETRSGEHLRELRLANLARVREIVQGALVHDLKGPLNAATLELDLLRQTIERDDSAPAPRREAQLEALQAVRRELKRLGSRLAEVAPLPDALDGERRRVDAVRLAARAVRLTRQQAILGNVRVELAGADDEIHVSASPGPLLHAVVNLLLNALEASPTGGTVGVACEVADGQVRIRVEDAGPGIDPADRDRAPETGFSRKDGHAGLGLAVATAIVEDHGGTIALADRPEGGTRAEITLPTVSGEQG
jgi:signal transduction histidine kinase